MLDPQKKEPVPEGALRRGTSNYDSQDSKSHNSQKQKQVASDDDGGNGIHRVGSSSSGSSSQSRRGPANGQYAGSDLPAAEDLTLVEGYTDHTTITAEASRNIGVAAKAKDLNTSLLTSDEMKKLEPMAVPPPINGDLYPDGGPGIQFGNVNNLNGMLMQSSSSGEMVDGSKQSIWVTPSFELNSSPSGGINSCDDVYVSNGDNAPQEPYTSERGLEYLPPLTPLSVSPLSPREKQLYAMNAKLKAHLATVEGNLKKVEGNLKKVEGNFKKVEGNLKKVEGNLKKFQALAHDPCKNQLIICAAEILKRTINIRGKDRGDGRQLFQDNLTDLVTVRSEVMGMLPEEYQQLSRRCINQRNKTAHFANIEALELAVAQSACAIELFPDFWDHIREQCMVIEKFEGFKIAFPDNFI